MVYQVVPSKPQVGKWYRLPNNDGNRGKETKNNERLHSEQWCQGQESNDDKKEQVCFRSLLSDTPQEIRLPPCGLSKNYDIPLRQCEDHS